MSGNAFLHIGVGKTGSTSIQFAMRSEAERLRRDFSINYPDSRGNHWLLALPNLAQEEFQPLENHRLRFRKGESELREEADSLVHRIRQDVPRYNTHVLSAEQLALLRPASVVGLKRLLDDLGLDVRVIVYVRHPAERLSSLISQKLRSGRASLATFRIEDGITPTLKSYTEVFGKDAMVVRRFGTQYFAGGSLIDDFTSIFHDGPIPDMPQLKLNESLSTPAVLLADRLYEIAPLTSGMRGLETYLLRIAGPKFRAPRAMVEQAMAANRGNLNYLEHEFGIRFDDVDLSQFPETIPPDFPPETVASLAELLNEQARALNRPPKRRLRRRIRSRLSRVFLRS